MNSLKLSAIALSSALIFGCGSSGDESPEANANKTGTFTNLLEGGYWEFGSANAASEDDLPNVYVLEGSTITYYYDDDDLGTYTAYPVSFDDDSAGHFTFDFYENTNTPTETTVLYSLSNGVLTLVTDTDELVDYEDHVGDSDVINAIAAVGSSVSPGGSTPVNTEVSSEDFESYSLGAILTSPWEVNYVDGTASSANLVADDASDGSQSIELYDGETDTKPNAILHFSDPVTSGSMSFYMKVPSGNIQACYAAMTTSKYYSARFMEMKVTASGSVYYEADTDVKIGTVSTNAWHRYDISWTDTTFSISVDNEKLASDITQASTGLYGTAPSEVKFMAGNQADIDTTCYFDDVEFVLPTTEISGDEAAEVTDDFESYTLGEELPEPWDDYTSGVKATIVADDAANGEQSLQLYDTEVDLKSYAMRYFDGASSAGDVSFDFKVASNNDQSCYIDVMSGTNTLTDIYAGFKISKSGIVSYTVEGDDNDEKIGTVSLDAWHNVQMSWTDSSFSIVIDGTSLANNLSQSETGLTGTAPELIRFIAGTFSGVNTNCRVDNIYSDSF